jgi:hypothetical protein
MSVVSAFFLGGLTTLAVLAIVRGLWHVALDVLADYHQQGPRAFFGEVVTSLGYTAVIVAVLVVVLAIIL